MANWLKIKIKQNAFIILVYRCKQRVLIRAKSSYKEPSQVIEKLTNMNEITQEIKKMEICISSIIRIKFPLEKLIYHK